MYFAHEKSLYDFIHFNKIKRLLRQKYIIFLKFKIPLSKVTGLLKEERDKDSVIAERNRMNLNNTI